MKNREFRPTRRNGALIVMALLTLVSSSAMAQTLPSKAGYGACGNGVLERKPDPYWLGTDKAEQCDIGPESNDRSRKAGCFSHWYYGGCMINQHFHGNGVIEHYKFGDAKNPIWEQCDDGNTDSSDTCADGIIKGSYKYPVSGTVDPGFPSLCGNGIIDQGEECDAGDAKLSSMYHTTGVCDPTLCQWKSTAHTSADGYACQKDVTLCGNGIVDVYAGEECDEGSTSRGGKNGLPGHCSALCTLPTSPTFDLSRVLFNGKALKGNMDGDISGLVVDPIESGKKQLPINPSNTGSNLPVTVEDRGRVIRIPYAPYKEYTGIFPSGQSIDHGVDIHFVLRPNNPAFSWDNDAFGLVFGVDSHIYDASKHPNYLMLSWRTRSGGVTGNHSPEYAGDATLLSPSDCSQLVKASPQGLRLYHIEGAVDYNELWQMKACDISKNITHIPTQYYSGTDPNQQKYNTYENVLPKEDKDFVTSHGNGAWNKMVNPAFTYSTYYLDDLKIIRDYQPQVFDIRAHYDSNGLQVWLNSQKVIDVSSSVLGSKWPKTGEWGFYVLGMDNMDADFRGTTNRVYTESDDPNVIAKLPNELSVGTRCDYCGDGYRQNISGGPQEKCDDGNQNSGDGCEPTCTYTAGWACDSNMNLPTNDPKRGRTTLCYTAGKNITSGHVFATNTPTLDGTVHFNDTATSTDISDMRVHVVVKHEDGSDYCRANVAMTPTTHQDASWSLSIDPTGLCSGGGGKKTSIPDGKYLLHLEYERSHNSDPIAKLQVADIPFTIATNAPTFTIKTPSATSPYYLPHTATTYSIGGTYDCSTGFSMSYSANGGSAQSLSIPNPCTPGKGNFSTSTLTATPGVATYSFVADNDYSNTHGAPTKMTYTVVVDRTPPPTPTVTQNGTPMASTVALDSGRVLHLSGNVAPEGADQAPVRKVTLKVESESGLTQPVTLEVPVDAQGNFSGALTLPAKMIKGFCRVTAVAEDMSGNQSSPFEKDAIQFIDGAYHLSASFLPSDSILGPNHLASGKIPVTLTLSPTPIASEIQVVTCKDAACSSPQDISSLCRATYDRSTGTCTFDLDPTTDLHLNPSAKDDFSIQVTALNTSLSKTYTYDPRQLAADGLPTIVKPKLSEKVASGNMEVEVKGTSKSEPGDTVVIFAGKNEIGTCMLAGSPPSCHTTVNAGAYVTGNAVDLSVIVKGVNGTETKPATRHVSIASEITVTSPASSTPPQAIAGWPYTLKGTSNCTSTSCAYTIKLHICEGRDDNGSNCEEVVVPKANIDAQGNWSYVLPATISLHGSPFEAGRIYSIHPYASAGSSDVAAPTVYFVFNPAYMIVSPTDGMKNPDGTVDVDVIGPPNATVVVTIANDDSKAHVVKCYNGAVEVPCKVGSDGHFRQSKVALIDTQTTKPFAGPYTIHAVFDDGGTLNETSSSHINLTPFVQINSPVDNSTLHDGNKINVSVDGEPGAFVKVTIFDSQGQSLELECVSPYDHKKERCRFDSTGHFTRSDVVLMDGVTRQPLVSPFKVVAEVEGNTGEVGRVEKGGIDIQTTAPPVVPVDNTPVVIISPKTKGDVRDEQGGISIDVEGPANSKIVVKVTGTKGYTKTVKCQSGGVDVPCMVGADHHFRISGVRLVSDDNHQLSGPFTVTAEVFDATGKPLGFARLPSVSIGYPVVSGSGSSISSGCGCSAADAPESGVLSLLLAALGLVVLRRRRPNKDE